MQCVCALCVSECQPLRWCCVTAAVQPLELAAHNDTLDILMTPVRGHYWRYLPPPPLQPSSVLVYAHSLSAHYWPLRLHSISANTATWKRPPVWNELMWSPPSLHSSQTKSKWLGTQLCLLKNSCCRLYAFFFVFYLTVFFLSFLSVCDQGWWGHSCDRDSISVMSAGRVSVSPATCALTWDPIQVSTG